MGEAIITRRSKAEASSSFILYKNGTTNTAVVGQWNEHWNYCPAYSVTATPTRTFGANDIYLATTQGSGAMGQFVQVTTSNTIDLTSYTTLNIDCDYDTGYAIYLQYADSFGVIGQHTCTQSGGTGQQRVNGVSSSGVSGAVNNTTLSFDISSATGLKKVGFELHSTGGSRFLRVRKFYLE